jgi:hypothetical protein
MRGFALLALAGTIMGCGGGSTDTTPDRYNFKVIRGLNQVTIAGSPTLGQPVVSKLTRDPAGQFASRSLWDAFLPRIAFAQDVTVQGSPVAGGVVCAPLPKPGEPVPFSICTNTLADGTAPFAFTAGTKAGTYNLKFVAQTETASLVTDSTTLKVDPGAPSEAYIAEPPGGRTLAKGATLDLHPLIVFVRDQYGNDVAWGKLTPGIALRDGSEPGQPTADSTSWTITWTQLWSGRRAFVYVFFGNARTSFTLDFE